LELGGSNDATNLWPEKPPTPNPKDKVEQVLNHGVCDGRVSLAAAQLAIARDWLTAESTLGLGGGGGGGGSGAWCTASASYNATYGDYDIYVHSNQPDKWAAATASNGASHGYWTDSSGYADIFLRAASGDTVRVTVGAEPVAFGLQGGALRLQPGEAACLALAVLPLVIGGWPDGSEEAADDWDDAVAVERFIGKGAGSSVVAPP
jgi:hypothetical protein